MNTNPNDPINPTIGSKNHGDLVEIYTNEYGLTKREHFAALAMSGYMGYEFANHQDAYNVAQYAVAVADALILELNKPPTI